MKTCRKCKSTDIITRKNYSHGRSSKASVSYMCRKCRSMDIAVREDFRGRRQRR